MAEPVNRLFSRLSQQRTRPELSPEDVQVRTPWRGELLQTSEVLPFGVYAQPDGTKRASWAVPGILRGNENALLNPASVYGDDQAAADQNVGRIGIGNALGMTSARPFYSVPKNALGVSGSGKPAQGITAYHGSPHDFDRFDLSKIGTGEGAQAFGHGLYFAEKEGVARSYRDALSDVPEVWVELARIAKMEAGGDRGEAIRVLEKELRQVEQSASRHRDADVAAYKRAIQNVSSGDTLPSNGRMYEVRINANADDFLDWDKPLKEQPEKVRSAWEQFKSNRPEYNDPAKVGGQYREPTGQQFYSAAFEHVPGMGEPARALVTQELKNYGIPGIRYLDQGSRTAGEGSRNYVVFDDKLVEILRKYGLLGAIGAGGYGAARAPDAQAAPTNRLFTGAP